MSFLRFSLSGFDTPPFVQTPPWMRGIGRVPEITGLLIRPRRLAVKEQAPPPGDVLQEEEEEEEVLLLEAAALSAGPRSVCAARRAPLQRWSRFRLRNITA